MLGLLHLPYRPHLIGDGVDVIYQSWCGFLDPVLTSPYQAVPNLLKTEMKLVVLRHVVEVTSDSGAKWSGFNGRLIICFP